MAARARSMASASMSVANTWTGTLRLAAGDLLQREHDDGVGLLAGGAARHPDAQRVAGGAGADQPRDHLRGQRLEGGRVAEEVGDADEQLAEQGLDLERVAPEEGDVVLHALDPGDGHAALHAAAQGVDL